jgi:hypothetical protein
LPHRRPDRRKTSGGRGFNWARLARAVDDPADGASGAAHDLTGGEAEHPLQRSVIEGADRHRATAERRGLEQQVLGCVADLDVHVACRAGAIARRRSCGHRSKQEQHGRVDRVLPARGAPHVGAHVTGVHTRHGVPVWQVIKQAVRLPASCVMPCAAHSSCPT